MLESGESRVAYKVYFLKPDKNDWVSRVIGLGLRIMGNDPDYTHVVLTQESSTGELISIIEMTTDGLDVVFSFVHEDRYAETLVAEVRQEIAERFTASVTLSVTLDLHITYIRALDTLIRSNCRAHISDFLRVFFGNESIDQPLCTYPVLELLGMKHNTLVLPKNLLGYFRDAVDSERYVLDHDIEITSLQVASYDGDHQW